MEHNILLIILLEISIFTFVICTEKLTNSKCKPCSASSPSVGVLQAAGFSPRCVAAALAECECTYNCDTFTEGTALEPVKYHDCSEIYNSGDIISGLKIIHPWRAFPTVKLSVYCDQETDGGGWTVIQRRRNDPEREDFYRTWEEYRLGFGVKTAEFWLGNDLISELTSSALQQLRIDLTDYEGEHRWAKYGYFHIGGENESYKLSIGRYTGDANDGLANQNGHKFSTHDRDHDSSANNCAKTYKGAWWYINCHQSNLNGLPHEGIHTTNADGINWLYWRGNKYSLAKTTMMIKPAY